MKSVAQLVLWTLGAFVALGCSQGKLASDAQAFDEDGQRISPDESNDPSQSDMPPRALEAREQQAYLQAVSPWLIGRVLDSGELATMGEPDAVKSVLESWEQEAGLAEAARRFVDKLVFTGGNAGDIDFNLPGNLAHTVTRQSRPWSEILTSDTCYDGSGAPIPCDSGAPYTAGLLTTRAYLASRAGRFNLTRASAMLGAFLCRSYPLPIAEEPHVEKSRLLVLFRAETAEEQEDARAEAGFGNGSECYNCHGQFGLHAQPFVRFDESGTWHADATGMQDPAEEAELGRSLGSLMTSHLQDPTEAANEASQMLGSPVDNLTGVAREIAQSNLFIPCQVRHLLEAVFSISGETPIAPSLLDDVTAAAYARNDQPTFHDLVVEAFSQRRVIDVYLASLPALDQQQEPEVSQ